MTAAEVAGRKHTRNSYVNAPANTYYGSCFGEHMCALFGFKENIELPSTHFSSVVFFSLKSTKKKILVVLIFFAHVLQIIFDSTEGIQYPPFFGKM